MSDSIQGLAGSAVVDDPRRAQFEIVRDAVEAQVAAEVAQLDAVVRLCVLYRSTDGDEFGPLMERLVPSGHDGTPLVSEFLCLELGPILGVSPESAAARLWRALDLVHRHPELHREVRAGRIRMWQADKISMATGAAQLSQQAAGWVDRQIAPHVARLPFGRVMKLVEGLIVQADPALAQERAQAAKERRRVHVRHDAAANTSDLFATLDLLDAIVLDRTCRLIAEKLAQKGDLDPLDIRRAKALGLLGTPGRAAALLQDDPAALHGGAERTPETTVVVHLSSEALARPSAAVARIDGIGAVVASHLTALLSHSRVTVRPVVDLNDVPAVDSYEIPDRIRRAVTTRTTHDAFPFGSRRASSCDLDHVERFQHLGPGGQTAADKLTPVSRRSHRAKTRGDWKLTMPRPGRHTWRSPLGYCYSTGPEGSFSHDSIIEARLQIELHAAQ